MEQDPKDVAPRQVGGQATATARLPPDRAVVVAAPAVGADVGRVAVAARVEEAAEAAEAADEGVAGGVARVEAATTMAALVHGGPLPAKQTRVTS